MDLRSRAADARDNDERAESADGVEQELLQRATNGDSPALSQLYDVYAPALHRVLSAILSNAEDAEDALQETFLRLLAAK